MVKSFSHLVIFVKTGVKNTKMIKNDEIEKAKTELNLAIQDFNFADQDHVSVATHRLNAANERLNVLIQQAKTQ